MDNFLNTIAGRTEENPPKTSNGETEAIEIKDMIKNFTEKVSEALKEKDEEIKRLTGILEELGKTFNSIVTEDPADEPINEPIDEPVPEGEEEGVEGEEGVENAAETDGDDKEKKGGYRYKVKRNSSLRKKKKSSIARSPNSLKKMK